MRTFSEIATFLLFCVFVALMTWNAILNDSAYKSSRETIKNVVKNSEEKKLKMANAFVDVITHDAIESTKTVVVTLDASTSFDAGNTANQITFTRPVPDKNRPKCADPNIKCTNECIDNGECEPLRNKCDQMLFESKCETWKGENCHRPNSKCECDKVLELPVDYRDDCEYLSLSHTEKINFVKRKMNKLGKKYRPDTELTYSWSLNQEKSTYKLKKTQPYKVSSTEATITIELIEGDYLFECLVEDPYGFKSMATKWVYINGESNDFPVANIEAHRAKTEK